MDGDGKEKSIENIIRYNDEPEDFEEIDKLREDDKTGSEDSEEKPYGGEYAGEEEVREDEPDVGETEVRNELDEDDTEHGGNAVDEEDDEQEYYDDYDEYYEYDDDEYFDDFDDEDEYKISTKALTVISVIVVAIALIGMLSFVDGGIIGQYKANLIKNVTHIAYKLGISSNPDTKTETDSVEESGAVINYETGVKYTQSIPMDGAGSSQFKKYKDGVICASANKIMFINSYGAVEWECVTVIVNPVLKTGGSYILLTEKNGKHMCLYNGSESVYDITIDDKILNCSVSANGDVAAVTDRDGYKGAVTVYNRNGEQIFSWASGSDNVISADISAKSRRVAATLLNSDGQAKSSVKIFNIKKTDAIKTIIFEDTIIFDVKFSGDTLNAFGDNSMVGITSGGRLLFDKRFDGAKLEHYSSDSGKHMMLFESSNIPLINVYNRKGKLDDQLTADAMPDVIDICGDYIAYNSGRTIISGRADTKDMTRFNADLDIKKLFLVNEKTFMIVYSNSVETVTME